MAKLYMFGTLALICAVLVAARNTYQKDDANIDEEVNALMRAILDPSKRTETSVASEENGDADRYGELDNGTDGEDEDSERALNCRGNCNEDVNTGVGLDEATKRMRMSWLRKNRLRRLFSNHRRRYRFRVGK